MDQALRSYKWIVQVGQPQIQNLAWVRLRSRAGLNDFHFHDLQHGAISRFFGMGLSIPEVALTSGHKDVKMLFRYTHLRAKDLVKKIN